MAGGNFLFKVVNYVANELIVNGLANSRAFQRFAVRTSRKFDDVSKLVAEKKIDFTEQMKDVSKNIEESFKNQKR